MAAAYAAAALAFTYAAVSLYWAAGGTTLLSTVGGSIEDIGRDGGLPAVALGLAAAALKLAGGVLALALVRPSGRVMPRAWLLACAVGASVVLACYGAIQVAAGSLVPRGLTVTIDHLDPRHGGTWRCIGADADGSKYAFRGVFHGTPSADGIVQTLESEEMPGHVCLQTVTFAERDGTTTVTQNTIYQSVQDRDRVLLYDNAEDIHESIERLEQLLTQLTR